jgi:colanic acid/amylovoran biosynthesis glycosyltransferase
MKIAYLMNTHPMTTTTFIRREIEALERRGFDVARYAVRRWDEKLVDPRDVRESERTTYLLSGNASGLVVAFFQETFANPRAVWRGFVQMLRLAKAARAGSVRHIAYLLEAVSFMRQAREDNVQHVHAHFATNAAAVALLSRVMGGPSYSFTAHGA